MSYIFSTATLDEIPDGSFAILEGDGKTLSPIVMRNESGRILKKRQIAHMKSVQKVAERQNAVVARLRKKVKEADLKKVEDSTA